MRCRGTALGPAKRDIILACSRRDGVASRGQTSCMINGDALPRSASNRRHIGIDRTRVRYIHGLQKIKPGTILFR